MGLDLGGDESCEDSMESSLSICFHFFDLADLAGVFIVFDLVQEAGLDFVAIMGAFKM